MQPHTSYTQAFASLQFWICLLIVPFLLVIPLLRFLTLSFKLNVLLTELPPIPKQIVALNSPTGSQPPTVPLVSDTSSERCLSCCRETLATRDPHLFTPGHRQFFTFVLYFSGSLPSMFCSFLLLLLVHFGAILLAVELVTVNLNQLYIHFLSLAHSVSPTSAPLHPSFLGTSVLLCNKIMFTVLSPLFQKFFQKWKMTIA